MMRLCSWPQYQVATFGRRSWDLAEEVLVGRTAPDVLEKG